MAAASPAQASSFIPDGYDEEADIRAVLEYIASCRPDAHADTHTHTDVHTHTGADGSKGILGLTSGPDADFRHVNVASLAPKPVPPFTGLINQGGTCYLNSLLQSLFRTHTLTHALMRWRHNPAIHGDVEDCIPAQMQALFARMALSSSSAVSTVPLTTAFGWSGGEVFAQNDAQEMLRALVDALERAEGGQEGQGSMHAGDAAEGAAGAREGQTSITAALASFTGVALDTVTCEVCKHARQREDVLADIDVPLHALPQPRAHPDDGTDEGKEADDAARAVPLQACLQSWAAEETLSESNAVWCDACNARNPARKCLRVRSWPQNLIVHMKRFAFDPTVGSAVKLSTPVAVPLRLSGAELADACENGVAPDHEYVLYAALLHAGGVASGHYIVMIRDAAADSKADDESSWISFNDAAVSRMSTAEVRAVLHLGSKIEASEASKESESTDLSNPKPDSRKPVGRGATPYLLLYERIEGSAKPGASIDTSHAPAVGISDLPDALRAQIVAENEQHCRVQRAYAARKRLCRVTVFPPRCVPKDRVSTVEDCIGGSEPASPLHLYVSKSRCVADLNTRVLHAFVAQGQLPRVDAACVRLRRVDMATRLALEDYADAAVQQCLLSAVDWGDSVVLVVETRPEPSYEWPVYDPLALTLRVLRWTPALADHVRMAGSVLTAMANGMEAPPTLQLADDALRACDNVTITIPGALVGNATVDDVSSQIACTEIGIPCVLQHLYYVPGGVPGVGGHELAPLRTAPRALTDPAAALVRDLHAQMGDVIIAKLASAEAPSSPASDEVLAALSSCVAIDSVVLHYSFLCPVNVERETATLLVAALRASTTGATGGSADSTESMPSASSSAALLPARSLPGGLVEFEVPADMLAAWKMGQLGDDDLLACCAALGITASTDRAGASAAAGPSKSATPTATASSDDAPEFTLQARRSDTLRDVKKRAVDALNAAIERVWPQVCLQSTGDDAALPPKLDAEEVHCRFGARGHQLRDENARLRDCDIGDGFVLGLGHGRALRPETVIICPVLSWSSHVEWLAPHAKVGCMPLPRTTVKVGQRVGALRRLLLSSVKMAVDRALGSMQTASRDRVAALTPHHLRLKVKSAATGATLGSMLRDEATVRAALALLVKSGAATAADGVLDEAQFAVELLPAAEMLTPSHIVLRIRELKPKEGAESRPTRRGSTLPTNTFSLSAAHDLVLAKDAPASSLADALMARFGLSSTDGARSMRERLRVAKARAFGPSLTATIASTELKYAAIADGDGAISASAPVSGPPLALEDGSVVVVRFDLGGVSGSAASGSTAGAAAAAAKPWARGAAGAPTGGFASEEVLVAVPDRTRKPAARREVGISIAVRGPKAAGAPAARTETLAGPADAETADQAVSAQ